MAAASHLPNRARTIGSLSEGDASYGPCHPRKTLLDAKHDRHHRPSSVDVTGRMLLRLSRVAITTSLGPALRFARHSADAVGERSCVQPSFACRTGNSHCAGGRRDELETKSRSSDHLLASCRQRVDARCMERTVVSFLRPLDRVRFRRRLPRLPRCQLRTLPGAQVHQSGWLGTLRLPHVQSRASTRTRAHSRSACARTQPTRITWTRWTNKTTCEHDAQSFDRSATISRPIAHLARSLTRDIV